MGGVVGHDGAGPGITAVGDVGRGVTTTESPSSPSAGDRSPVDAFFAASRWSREDVRLVLGVYSAVLLTLLVVRGGSA
jgi:hypothetical protein